MNYKMSALAVMALLSGNFAHSASIYKCTTKEKNLIFTDKPCPPNTEGRIIYTETEKEIQRRALEEKTAIIRRLIINNQVDAAKEYATKNNLSAVYRKQLDLYLKQKTEQEKLSAEQEKQQQLMLQQQALAVQKQQLELQKQQMAIDKAKLEEQEQLNNQPYYYVYPRMYHPPKDKCQWSHDSKHCLPTPLPPQKIPQLSTGGMNPPQSFTPQMNPPSSGGLNPLHR